MRIFNYTLSIDKDGVVTSAKEVVYDVVNDSLGWLKGDTLYQDEPSVIEKEDGGYVVTMAVRQDNQYVLFYLKCTLLSRLESESHIIAEKFFAKKINVLNFDRGDLHVCRIECSDIGAVTYKEEVYSEFEEVDDGYSVLGGGFISVVPDVQVHDHSIVVTMGTRGYVHYAIRDSADALKQCMLNDWRYEQFTGNVDKCIFYTKSDI